MLRNPIRFVGLLLSLVGLLVGSVMICTPDPRILGPPQWRHLVNGVPWAGGATLVFLILTRLFESGPFFPLALALAGMCLVGMFLFPALAICSLAKRSRRRGFYRLAVSGVVCLVTLMGILGAWGMLSVADGWIYSQPGITEALRAVENIVTSMVFVCAALGLVELIACCWVLDRVLKGQQ